MQARLDVRFRDADDLGDFLAWVTLSGQGVPPELMARLLAAAGPNTGDAPKGVTP